MDIGDKFIRHKFGYIAEVVAFDRLRVKVRIPGYEVISEHLTDDFNLIYVQYPTKGQQWVRDEYFVKVESVNDSAVTFVDDCGRSTLAVAKFVELFQFVK